MLFSIIATLLINFWGSSFLSCIFILQWIIWMVHFKAKVMGVPNSSLHRSDVLCEVARTFVISYFDDANRTPECFLFYLGHIYFLINSDVGGHGGKVWGRCGRVYGVSVEGEMWGEVRGVGKCVGVWKGRCGNGCREMR